MSLAMALMVGVGGCAAIRGPAWEPRNVEPESGEAEESDNTADADTPGYDEVDPFGTDPDVPDTDEPEGSKKGDAVAGSDDAKATESGSAREATPAKKTCADLDESTCKVTVGCAWDSIKDCVEE